ncbi:TPA: hypothetical protein EYO57_09955 [Candidatus Poribacteria bacterium]|nr:hypothetical protein [Candidatus Poribacteria bacterium]HIN28219.1 hypothetical protein [Candidatus Poribacteria bacterium]
MDNRLPQNRILFAIGFICLPLVYLSYQAFVSPQIEFLRPALRGKWITHPNPPIDFQQSSTCPNVIFYRDFQLDEIPEKEKIRVTAMRSFWIRVNNEPIPFDPPNSWKSSIHINLVPYLQSGQNTIRIQVGGPKNPPALLVEGRRLLRSGENWQVALKPDLSDLSAASIALQDEHYLNSNPNPIRQSTFFVFYLIGFLAYSVLGVVVLFIRPNETKFDQDTNLWKKHGFCFLLFLIAVIIQLHNVSTYAHTRSHFDWQGHVDYIQHIATHWKIPIATDGWEMFQPPLYYLISAVILKTSGGSLKAVQIFTTLTGLGNLLFSWFLLCQVFPTQTRKRNLGFSVIAMLPMGFYMNSMVSNEIFSGSVISGTIVLSTYLLFKKGLTSYKASILIGLASGLGLLSKYTALFVLLSLLLLLGLRFITRQITWKRIVTVICTVSLTCGWLYGRNIVRFGDPFIGNWDEASGFHYEQSPGYRNVQFYTQFGSVFYHLPVRSRWVSFWDGKYGSMWTDTHGTFLNLSNPTTQLLGSLSLWLALLPTLAIVFGFGYAIKFLIRHEWNHPYFVMVTTSVLTILSLVSFTMEIPTYSTIKAFFFLSMIPIIGVFAALGLERLCLNLGKLRWIVYIHLGTFYGIVSYLFWYRGT